MIISAADNIGICQGRFSLFFYNIAGKKRYAGFPRDKISLDERCLKLLNFCLKFLKMSNEFIKLTKKNFLINHFLTMTLSNFYIIKSNLEKFEDLLSYERMSVIMLAGSVESVILHITSS